MKTARSPAKRITRPASHETSHTPGADGHRSFWLVAITAAACVAFSVTFKLNDADFWEHLLVGKVIWQLHTVPTTHMWSWPTFGTPEVLPSWGFRALIWPFWSGGGVLGIFLWRWISTLTIFALCYLTSRRLGARGLATFVVIAACALVYRHRSQVRPETLATLLLVIEVYLLELRRSGGPDRTPWIIPLAWTWANSHISYYLCFVLLAAYSLSWRAGRLESSQVAGRSSRRLLLVGLLAAVACFANPFGWRALGQPFEYFFLWRREPIYRTIAELHGIDWQFNARNGLAILMVLWPSLQLYRAARRSADLVEFLLWVFFTVITVLNQRFVGTWAVVAAVFLGRDLDWWVERTLQGRKVRAPWLVASAAAGLCVVLSLPEWRRAQMQPGIGIDPLSSPVAAGDFIERHEIRGRFFNHFELGGYLLWRFWPQKDRLPFMDIHQSGTPRERTAYVASMTEASIWQQATVAYGFDVAILRRVHAQGDRLLDFLDADSTWAMVFVDDVAAIYLRRTGKDSLLAQRLAFQVLPGGMTRLGLLGGAVARDSSLRGMFRMELVRAVSESRANSSAHSLLATLDLQSGRLEEARAHLYAGRLVDPLMPRYFARLATIDRAEERWAQALENFRRAKQEKELGDIDAYIAPLLERLNRPGEARRAYEAALRKDPTNEQLRAGLSRTSSH